MEFYISHREVFIVTVSKTQFQRQIKSLVLKIAKNMTKSQNPESVNLSHSFSWSCKTWPSRMLQWHLIKNEIPKLLEHQTSDYLMFFANHPFDWIKISNTLNTLEYKILLIIQLKFISMIWVMEYNHKCSTGRHTLNINKIDMSMQVDSTETNASRWGRIFIVWEVVLV